MRRRAAGLAARAMSSEQAVDSSLLFRNGMMIRL